MLSARGPDFDDLFVRKAIIAAFCDHHMVQKRDVASLQCILQALCLLDVSRTGKGTAGRMVVNKNKPGSLLFQGSAHNGLTVHDGGLQASGAHHLLAYQMIGPVEI